MTIRIIAFIMMTFSIVTFSMMTFTITTFSIETLGIIGSIMTLKINNTPNNDCRYIVIVLRVILLSVVASL
jgi:hypothetical protein